MMTLPGRIKAYKLLSIRHLSAVAAVAMIAGIAEVHASPKIGTTSSVQGTAYVLTEGARRKAQVRDSIQLNDEVQTKDDSALQVLLLDQTIFTPDKIQQAIIAPEDDIAGPHGHAVHTRAWLEAFGGTLGVVPVTLRHQRVLRQIVHDEIGSDLACIPIDQRIDLQAPLFIRCVNLEARQVRARR